MIQTHLNLSTIHGDAPRLKKVQQKQIDDSCSYGSISPEYYEGILSIFHELGVSNEITDGGSSIVERIVAFHTGSLWVKSNWCHNRTFFTLRRMVGMFKGRN